jgi:hypothetical protein
MAGATPPKSWAKLTMFDRVQQRMHDFGATAHPTIRNLVRSARPFVVTERAAERVREAMATYPELIAENSAFAIPPFQTMWIEFPSRTMLRHHRLSGITDDADLARQGLLPIPGLGLKHPIDDPTTDLHVGYLIGANTVIVFAEGEELKPTVLPFSYRLHRPMPLDEQEEAVKWFGATQNALDPFLWGHTLCPTLDRKHQRMLANQHTFLVSEALLHRPASEVARSQIMRGSAGELRNILAILLMVNQPANVIRTREVPRTHGLVKGRRVSYWGHSLIDINLDATTRVNVLARPKGASNFHMPWHEVRGHFVHRNARGSNHAHEWLADPDRERRWRCGAEGCKALRTWREYPEGHGSANVGYVDQVRRVRTGAD